MCSKRKLECPQGDGEEKSPCHVAMVAKFLDLNKPWYGKYGKKKNEKLTYRRLSSARLHSPTNR